MNKTRVLLFLAIIILLVDLAYFYPQLTGQAVKLEIVNLTDVIDGDTIAINNESRVRLLCINTPERGKRGYDEAREFLEKLEGEDIGILKGKYDEDKYNRKLRYLFYGNKFLNKEILNLGLGNLYMCEGKYSKELEKAEESARKNELGIWEKSTTCGGCIKLLELNATEEFFILRNSCSFTCELLGKDEANHFFNIQIKKGEDKTINSKGRVWNNDGDSLFLWDDEGLVLYYSY